MTSLTSCAQFGYRSRSVAIFHTTSGAAAIVIVSVAVSAMVSILPDLPVGCSVLWGGLHGLAPGAEGTVRHRPETVQAESQHRHQESDCQGGARVAVRPVGARQCGDQRDRQLRQQ